jgi:hypothetical protein
MAHVSRPYQIALGALVVFALAWFVVLHRPGSSSSEPASAPAPAAHTATAKPAAPGASTPVYHGAVPGLTGLTRDIARAHGAVATSEQNARQLQKNSAQASNEASTSQAGSPAAATSAPSSTTTLTAHRTATHTPATGTASAAATAIARQAAQQAVLRNELKQGKTVLLLFWNPKATDDQAVRREVQAVSKQQKGKVAVHVAIAGQVSLYGSVTRNVGIFQTPTLLIIGKHGRTVTLTGLVDEYTIEQAIVEAKAASHHA